jgi:ribosomal protein S18 acetylase RimI-like enzyme
VTIVVRPVRPDEFDEAGRVTALAYREFVRPEDPAGWEGYLARIADIRERAGRTVVLVAVEGEAILGSATLELDGRTDADEEQPLAPGEAHVRMLGVRSDARRRGVARLLMDACTDEARRAGRKLLSLNTAPRMTAARQMYESMGFERGPDTVFPDGFVLLSYEKPIP